MISEKWIQYIEQIDYAFQPIVNTLTGVTFAVEALIRNVDKAGFNTIADLFDTAYQEKTLFMVDIELRKKAIKKFSEIPFHHNIKLFYNYDPRVLEMSDYRFGVTEEILQKNCLNNEVICFELNERHQVKQNDYFKNFITNFKERGFKLALDDFGAGFASFELFYHSEPDYLKFDHFLIKDIDRDLRKNTFCAHIVNMAKLLGVLVIAEGIERIEELETCQKIGFDLVQGYLIQKPTLYIEDLFPTYSKVIQAPAGMNLNESRDVELITQEIVKLETIDVYDDIKVLFDKFHKNSQFDFFPVLDKSKNPLGIIHEKTIKKYVYSPYGKDLLCNKSVTTSLRKFISKCPIIDLNTPQEKILEIYLNNPDSEGVIITKAHEYFGFLTAKSLLNIINEKNLALAREVNPLTKLPGNILVNLYLEELVKNPAYYYYLIYFDFNNFKPFNDKYGFGQGDRVLKLFADILRNIYHSAGSFIGHIGGDDFFVGLKREQYCMEEEIQQAQRVIDQFAHTVRIFHSESELNKGYYTTKDRYAKVRKLPLLSACFAIIEVPCGDRNYSPEEISFQMAQLKKEAKNSLENKASDSLQKNEFIKNKFLGQQFNPGKDIV